MPESRKRKPKRNRNTRQRLAERDGERIHIPACCPDTELELGVGKLNIRHSDECPAIHPAEPGYLPARLQANAAAAQAISQRGIGSVGVVVLGGRR